MKIKFNIQADTPNINGTIYPKDVLKKAISEYNEKCKNGEGLGILKQPKTVFQDLSKIAFKLNKIDIVDESYIGDIKILDTREGKYLTDLLNVGDIDNYRIVTISTANVVKVINDNVLVKDMEIRGIGIEPKENCVPLKENYDDC